jgi:hypothetical protein
VQWACTDKIILNKKILLPKPQNWNLRTDKYAFFVLMRFLCMVVANYILDIPVWNKSSIKMTVNHLQAYP